MSDEAGEAFEAAKKLIAQAKEEGWTALNFDPDQFNKLTKIPDAISELVQLQHLSPAYSPNSDRSGCVRLKVL